MVKLIYNLFYGKSLYILMVLMTLLIVIWSLSKKYFEHKLQKAVIWKILNICLFTCGMAGVLIVTLMSRNGSEASVILTPFYSFLEAKTQPELYRSMFMNIFLFFPLGLTLPFALPEKWNRRALITILFSMVLSITIECLQYHYHLGRAETDDVICNTLGAIIGTLSYTLSRKVNTK